jgi:hypothetical protein
MKNAVFWDVTPCGSRRNRRFGGNHSHDHQDVKNLRARNISSNQQLKHTVLKEPHDLTSQKTALFIVTAVKTSNLTWH